MLLLRSLQDRLRVSYVLVWHDDHEAFARILIGLQLIILGVNSSRVAQEQQKLGGEMRVVAGLRNVDINVGYL